MAFSDPQSLTVVGGAVSLPRVGTTLNQGIFQSSDGNAKLTLSHSPGGSRTRHLARVDLRKIASDPFTSTLNAQYTMAAYLVVDVPNVGYSVADQVTNAAGLASWLTATTNARLTQFLGGES